MTTLAAREVELAEQLAALAVGQPGRRGARDLEHVEDVVGDGHPRLQDLRGVRDAVAPAQLARAGPAHPVERHHDAVEHQPARGRPRARRPRARGSAR